MESDRRIKKKRESFIIKCSFTQRLSVKKNRDERKRESELERKRESELERERVRVN
jgi:hypothetical protein